LLRPTPVRVIVPGRAISISVIVRIVAIVWIVIRPVPIAWLIRITPKISLVPRYEFGVYYFLTFNVLYGLLHNYCFFSMARTEWL
jgi:hypothetical protein